MGAIPVPVLFGPDGRCGGLDFRGDAGTANVTDLVEDGCVWVDGDWAGGAMSCWLVTVFFRVSIIFESRLFPSARRD